MATLTLRAVLEKAEVQVRRPLGGVEGYWATNVLDVADITLVPGTTKNLPAGARVVVTCSAGLSLVLGWMQSSTQVEVPIDQIAVVATPLTGAYVRNAAASGTPDADAQIITF